MGLSDSPATCMSAVRHYAFADRSLAMEAMDVAGVSRLPRERFPTVRVVYDSVRATPDSPLTFDVAVAFPLSGQGRPYKKMFSELNTLPGCASVNASRSRAKSPRSGAHSRLVSHSVKHSTSTQRWSAACLRSAAARPRGSSTSTQCAGRSSRCSRIRCRSSCSRAACALAETRRRYAAAGAGQGRRITCHSSAAASSRAPAVPCP